MNQKENFISSAEIINKLTELEQQLDRLEERLGIEILKERKSASERLLRKVEALETNCEAIQKRYQLQLTKKEPTIEIKRYAAL